VPAIAGQNRTGRGEFAPVFLPSNEERTGDESATKREEDV
jgi:hypothetical protein